MKPKAKPRLPVDSDLDVIRRIEDEGRTRASMYSELREMILARGERIDALERRCEAGSKFLTDYVLKTDLDHRMAAVHARFEPLEILPARISDLDRHFRELGQRMESLKLAFTLKTQADCTRHGDPKDCPRHGAP